MSTAYPNRQHAPLGTAVAIVRGGAVLVIASNAEAAYKWLSAHPAASEVGARRFAGLSTRLASQEEIDAHGVVEARRCPVCGAAFVSMDILCGQASCAKRYARLTRGPK